MNEILIALDFDPSAQKVAEDGYSIANAIGANITLVHVKSEANYYSSVGRVTVIGFSGHLNNDEPKSPDVIDPETISQEFLNNSKLHLGNEKINTKVVGGACAEALLNTAKELESDLIIMGSHSRRWFEENSIGGVTDEVLRYSRIPVLVIPTNKST